MIWKRCLTERPGLDIINANNLNFNNGFETKTRHFEPWAIASFQDVVHFGTALNASKLEDPGRKSEPGLYNGAG